MKRSYYIAGFCLGLLGVVLGAFAAHGLKPNLSPQAMETFETGVRFQIYHAFLILILANMDSLQNRNARIILYVILTGVFLFSGSIYLLATNSITAPDFSILGPVTPLGGSLLIFCWGFLIFHSIKLKIK
ncbi:DUF423 domain-containing protein [Antarcticibacterium arcticum]|uniref:DUF423 domain-containing protein n=1 Tax=Antarcticibacterium arcticum TaxID=2585771 RepID=A0A5B8YQ11_9FLAO|nr:DUF423 domain-containing protein [Antarcticibacterium arcticum]QED38743.1 DUF423 domain-containing protein [Antarcticibacterium arcticum]